MSLHIAILYGSVREKRAGIRLVRFLDAALQRRGHETSVIDAAEYRLPLLDRMYKEYERGTAPCVLKQLADIYRRTDAFAIVSGEYNHGIPPALKNLLDHFLRGVFLPTVGDRLLLGRPVRRRAGGDATANDSGRIRHAEYSLAAVGAAH